MRLLILLLSALALWGCSSAPQYSLREESGGAMQNDDVTTESYAASSAAAPAPMMAKRAMLAEESVSYQDASTNAPAQVDVTQSMEATPTPGTQTGRMVFYNGGIELKATQPEALLDTATRRVQALGGYVESRNPNYAVLRVPVAHFRSYFEMAQTLGVLQNKWMRADDITDAFQDNALRIQIGEATLARLHELLAASTDDNEKLNLLREIQRVNDELEVRKNQQALLAQQAAYSRLELNVQPFVFETGRADLGIQAFAWFAQLNATRTAETRLGKKVELQVPAGLVPLDLKKAWAARSADGVDFWTFRRENEPQGDSAFWRDAIRNSLAPSFAKADTFTVGSFAVLRLESFGPDSYVWWIAASTCKRKLYMAEAFFPDLAAEQRHAEAIRSSLAGGVQ